MPCVHEWCAIVWIQQRARVSASGLLHVQTCLPEVLFISLVSTNGVDEDGLLRFDELIDGQKVGLVELLVLVQSDSSSTSPPYLGELDV